MKLKKEYVLNNGVVVPSIGLGTWQSSEEDAYFAVTEALKAGYRHIDTASIYRNEKAVGQAIADSGIPRSEIFVTTKLWNDAHGYEEAKQAFHESLERLGMDYVDLYLIHWPNPKALRPNWQEPNRQAWKAMEELYEAGLIRAIGVSNFRVHHLEELFKTARIIPAINQIRLAPGALQPEVTEWCEQHEIQVEAYSPFGTGRLFENETIKKMAEDLGKSPAQIALNWSLSHGFLPLPKSVHQDRIQSNLNVFDFELSQEQMEIINHLEGLGSNHSPDEMNF
ncbi:aldo/keto reductase [Atopobacter phocae]|uniref:aldo/keto reductase n=1 Tax=Atopobacter phocae TaxID=136492 RepID=UPI00046FE951|nr:aldo/keto reductase [Atopobacter phocae]